MKKIIYHYPSPLEYNPVKGSQLRPLEMMKAFLEMGYDVDAITGYGKKRKLAIKKIKDNIKKGIKYDFAYCENTTMPTLLTEPHHYPLYPRMDFDFFRFLKKNKINIGLYYRDIHWLFPFYDKKTNKIKSSIAKFFYNHELIFYNKVLTKFYIPSIEMASYIPHIKASLIDILPPGHNKINLSSDSDNFSEIHFLYVGGISEFYDLSLFIKTIRLFPQIKLTICTRKNEWEAIKEKFHPLPKNINVVHKKNNELQQLYEQSNIALLYVKPQEYWEFAVPIKLLEYIGYKKPVLVSEGTWGAKFINTNGNGWAIPYGEKNLTDFLSKLTTSMIYETKENCLRTSIQNTWLSRAKKVSIDLSNNKESIEDK